jgi:drug/metabolite transporter (DMT)-like permease
MSSADQKNISLGFGLAVLATLIWSGNFIIARKVITEIPPISLAFYRWLSATIIISFLARKYFLKELQLVRQHFMYFLFAAITGISIFNTFVYIAGHYTTAINMALLGTCTSPVIAVVLARIFLKEKITGLRIIGMSVTLIGILLLLSRGHLERLISFSFTKGDWWVLAAALSFAIYNTLVKKKPSGMHPINFLFVIFLIGTIILLPFYLFELKTVGGFEVNSSSIFAISYIGIGASVICFWIWNIAIANLGAGTTALFGNLIPVFSSIEAVIILNEKITSVHIFSFMIVVLGLIIANLKKRKIGAVI